MTQRFSQAAPSVAAVHDLSGVGRCALTVVIPVLAAMGLQPCPLPTAVLSTHTGGYTGMAVKDLTDFMPAYIAHWKSLNLKFDALYTGYLACEAQADLVLDLFAWQKALCRPFIVVDPVMGDEGELYSTMTVAMAREMRRLCAMADVITPNLTEAHLLLGQDYQTAPRTPAQIQDMLSALLELGPKHALITSMPTSSGPANVCMSRGDAGYHQCAYPMLPVQYPGTGDLFASVLTGAMVKGEPLQNAMNRASHAVYRAVRDTWALGTEVRAGVQLELSLNNLWDEPDAGRLRYVHPQSAKI